MNEAWTQEKAPSPNPSRIRHFFKKGPGAVIFRSDAYRKLLLWKHFVSSSYHAASGPDLFKDVRTYCMFVGHNKSGTSMIGALLDAHPNAIVADEADALEFVSAGFSRDQIFHLLLRRSRKEYQKGRVTARRLQPYSYLVPGQWQGRYRNLQVIGDGTAGSATKKFASEPDLLNRLQSAMHGVDVKIIQIIRNPYDPISAMMVRGKRSFENAIDTYFSYCEALTQLRQRVKSDQLFAIRYEDFVRDSEWNLREICRFLGMEAEPSYLKACSAILHDTPETSRHLVQWDPKHINLVAAKIERFDFLQGYSFEASPTLNTLTSPPQILDMKLDQLESLESVRKLFEAFTSNNIRYCHWKSNLRLEHGLLGKTDMDLLVDPAQTELLRQVLLDHHVKPILAPAGKRYPGIEDYLGFDYETGKLYHLHVHYQLVLGEQFVKNYHLPLEEQFLNSTVSVGGWINIPTPELELSILCLRALLKYRDRDAFKDMLSIRSGGIPAHILNELNWLSEQTSMSDLTRVLSENSGMLPADVILKFLETIRKNPRDGFKLWLLREQVRKTLSRYQRKGRLLASVQYFRELWRRKLVARIKPTKGMKFLAGGLTVTLIGADGAGKSTLCRALEKWLAWRMDVHSYYLGSKQPSYWTYGSRLAFRVARRLDRETDRLFARRNLFKNLLMSFRQIFLSIFFLSVGNDRYKRYLEGKKQARNGAVVFFDRFPYESPLDGPEIQQNAESTNGALVGFFSQRELKLYSKFTSPDFLIILNVTPEVSTKRKPDHSLETIQEKEKAIAKLKSKLQADSMGNWANQNADLPLADVLLQLKRKIWPIL